MEHFSQIVGFFKNKSIYLIYLFLAALGLRYCARAFSSCGKQGPLLVAVCRLLIAVASLVAEHGLQAHGLQQLWHAGSVVVAHGLQSAGSLFVVHGLSCSTACGIFPDQGSNPCPLHWQVDSQPLRHQGSPNCGILSGVKIHLKSTESHSADALFHFSCNLLITSGRKSPPGAECLHTLPAPADL